MTKEELEKEAGDYADEHAFRVPYDGSNKFYDDVDFKASKEGYLAGAEPREKRIEELEKENDKLILGNKSLSEKVVSATREKLDLQKENKELRDKYLQATDEGTSWAHLKSLEKENAELNKINAELNKINAEGLSELNHINGDLLIENEKLRKENTELREQHYADCEIVKKISEIIGQLNEAKDIIERLLINRPDTYSGTYVELIQSKMFQFNRAVSDADDFLRN